VALLPDDAIEEFLRLYGAEELERARALIGSSTLREAAALIVEPQLGSARIVVPHYWAVYYHDGRGAFAAPAGRFLVYFADPDDDPRLEGGRPVREADARRLTREQFLAGLEENEARAAVGAGPFMFVVRSVGPAGAHPFFDQLADGAAFRADFLAQLAIDQHVQDSIDEEGPQRSTARVRL
jgi:hypothetical protein